MNYHKLTTQIATAALICGMIFGFVNFGCMNFGCVNVARAASIVLDSPTAPVVIGSDYVVNVMLDTAGENINAVAARVNFPPGVLSFKGWSDGNSIVNYWVLRPDPEASGTVSFSGIIPGGYSGRSGKLLSLTFSPARVTSASIWADSLTLLLNDGKGTETSTSTRPLVFTTNTSAVNIAATSSPDTVPPLPFRPIVARDPHVFGGAYFLSFSTTDKGAGVDHFEVKEGSSAYVRAASPYRLSDQSLSSPVLVLALDRAGNRRIEAYTPASHVDGKVLLIAIGCIGMIILFVSVLLYRRRGVRSPMS